MSKNKKQEQLGMNPSTASNRLAKDLLFHFIQKEGIKCHHCKQEMARQNFSIEHIEPWLDSKNPVELYFNLQNVTFSHLSCNVGARREVKKPKHPSLSAYEKRGCRCDECKKLKAEHNKKYRK